jgi:hypothetical protein
MITVALSFQYVSAGKASIKITAKFYNVFSNKQIKPICNYKTFLSTINN